jgi:hypothetical protein
MRTLKHFKSVDSAGDHKDPCRRETVRHTAKYWNKFGLDFRVLFESIICVRERERGTNNFDDEELVASIAPRAARVVSSIYEDVKFVIIILIMCY